MRLVRSHALLDRDGQLGGITTRQLIPHLWRRPGRFRLSPTRLHYPSSLGYLSWLAFLVFWIVFGRLTLFYFMTTDTFNPIPRGVELILPETRLSQPDVTMLMAGEAVNVAGDLVKLNRADHDYYHLRVDDSGRMTFDGRDADEADLETICTRRPRCGKRPVVFVSVPDRAIYQQAVSAIDLVYSIAEPLGCYVEVIVTSARPDA